MHLDRWEYIESVTTKESEERRNKITYPSIETLQIFARTAAIMAIKLRSRQVSAVHLVMSLACQWKTTLFWMQKSCYCCTFSGGVLVPPSDITRWYIDYTKRYCGCDMARQMTIVVPPGVMWQPPSDIARWCYCSPLGGSE